MNDHVYGGHERPIAVPQPPNIGAEVQVPSTKHQAPQLQLTWVMKQ